MLSEISVTFPVWWNALRTMSDQNCFEGHNANVTATGKRSEGQQGEKGFCGRKGRIVLCLTGSGGYQKLVYFLRFPSAITYLTMLCHRRMGYGNKPRNSPCTSTINPPSFLHLSSFADLCTEAERMMVNITITLPMLSEGQGSKKC